MRQPSSPAALRFLAIFLVVVATTLAIGALVRSGVFDPALPLTAAEQTLLTASRRGDLDAVKQTIAGGVNVNVQEAASGDTALMRAAGFNHLDVMRTLLDAGARPDVRRPNGTTALYEAASEGHADAARMLVAAKAPIEAPGGGLRETPLARAISHGYADAARALLDGGASPTSIVLADVIGMGLGNVRGEGTARDEVPVR